MKSLVQLIAHRESVNRAFNLIKAAIPAEFHAPLAQRVARHDIDKFEAIKAQDAAKYALHDFRNDHHVAYWLCANQVTDVQFLEHLLDHIAVNLDREQSRLFCIEWFYQCDAFDRDPTIGALCKALPPVFESIKQQYLALCAKYSELLVFCDTKLG